MVLTLFMVFCSAVLVGYIVVPMLWTKTVVLGQKRASRFSNKMERVLPKQQIEKLSRLYIFAPVGLAAALFFVFPAQLRLFGVFLGLLGGLFFPGIYIKILTKQNRQKFDDQLVDALMIMTSSFRGGLSLVQALEAVVEEMSDPISMEFSTVLGENNMGVSLDESLNHLYNRMPSNAVQQMNTAILLARETGGNLPAIFQRIVSVIREQKRIQGQIQTLTIQGKIQGIVMSLLPVAFFWVIYATNPHFFDHMFVSKTGQFLLVYACISEAIGAFFIWKISSFKDF